MSGLEPVWLITLSALSVSTSPGSIFRTTTWSWSTATGIRCWLAPSRIPSTSGAEVWTGLSRLLTSTPARRPPSASMKMPSGRSWRSPWCVTLKSWPYLKMQFGWKLTAQVELASFIQRRFHQLVHLSRLAAACRKHLFQFSFMPSTSALLQSVRLEASGGQRGPQFWVTHICSN